MSDTIYGHLCKTVSYLMIIMLSILTLFSLISTTFVNSFDQVYYIGDNAFLSLLFRCWYGFCMIRPASG